MMRKPLAMVAIFALLATALTACGRPASAPVAPPAAESGTMPDNFDTGKATVVKTSQGIRLQAFSFTTETSGWAAAGSTIYVTRDGGHSWAALTEFSGNNVRDLDFTDQDTGWAATDRGLLLTRDGGRTWTAVAVDLKGAPSGVRFLDGRRGWVYAAGRLLRTLDGGATWENMAAIGSSLSNSYAPGFFSFIDANTGWMLQPGESGAGSQMKALYRTVDGGRTWQPTARTAGGSAGPAGVPTSLPAAGSASDLFFLDATHGWLSTSRGGLYATTDGGRSWRSVPVGNGGETPILGVRFVTSSRGYVLLSTGGLRALLVTEDGGATWTQRYPSPAPVLSQEAVHFADPQRGFGSGTSVDPGAILATVDGGQSWREVYSFGPSSVVALNFADSRHGWAVVERFDASGRLGRTLYRTADGGGTWAAAASQSDAKELLASIAFVDDHTGFALSGWGHLSVTHDGGTTFEAVDVTDSQAYGLRFTDATHGWKVDEGRILWTADAGSSWSPVPLEYRAILVEPMPGGNLWVIANDPSSGEPVLLSTEDAGKNWVVWNLGDLKPQAVWFVDPADGWLADSAGALYQTIDGGRSWDQVH